MIIFSNFFGIKFILIVSHQWCFSIRPNRFFRYSVEWIKVWKTIFNENWTDFKDFDFYLLFFRMHRTIQQATTPMMHSVNTSAPTIVATKMIGCLIFTTNNLRSIETAFRMMTNTVNDLTFNTLCAYWRFCWHSSMVDHCSHVSRPSIMYGPSMWRMQYSKFGEPLQKMLSS